MLEEHLKLKQSNMQQLEVERESLRSAQSARASSRTTTPPTAQELRDETKLKEVGVGQIGRVWNYVSYESCV